MIKKLLSIIILCVIAATTVFGQDVYSVEVYVFHKNGCPACARAEQFFHTIEEKYPNVDVIEKEISTSYENNLLFQDFANRYQTKIEGVPTIFIGDRVFVGNSLATEKEIEAYIQTCTVTGCSIKGESPQTVTLTQTYNDESKIGWAFIGIIGVCVIYFLIYKMVRRKKK